MSTKLIMRRSGEFQADWAHGGGKCGTETNLQTTYFYDCTVEARPSLDKNDFLIDQLDIDKYFQNRYKSRRPSDQFLGYTIIKHSPRSCERIALNAVNDIALMLNDHFMKHHDSPVGLIVTSLKVSIGFNQRAVMTAEWTPDKRRRQYASQDEV